MTRFRQRDPMAVQAQTMRVTQQRTAAASVAAASNQAKAAEEVAAVAAGVPPDLTTDLSDLEARVVALETP